MNTEKEIRLHKLQAKYRKSSVTTDFKTKSEDDSDVS